MSLDPAGPPQSPESAVPVVQTPSLKPKRWQGRVSTFCFAVFAFELGLFLVIFPWQDSWSFNYFQGVSPAIENIWDEPSFRGLLTGLGLVNIYISLLQVIRLFRRTH
jgi:hypothetical protein